MTHPITEPNIRERLARAACYGDRGCDCKSPTECEAWTAEYIDHVDAILAEQAAIRAERREADQRSTEQRVLDDLGQSQPDWAKDIRDGGK